MELSPDGGHSKYMYLGQIHTGAEAVQYFSKGIEVMLKAIDMQDQEVRMYSLFIAPSITLVIKHTSNILLVNLYTVQKY